MRKLNNKQLKYRKIFLGKLTKGVYKVQKNRCPCGATRDFLLLRQDSFEIPLRVVLCKSCGTMRADPYYTESTLRRFYGLEYRNLYEANSRVSKKFFDHEVDGGRFIYKYLFNNYYKKDMAGKTVFEIGCSAGGILFHFKKVKNEVYGCDYDSTYVRYGRKKGLNLKVGGIEQLEKTSKKADVIILCHVLEHFSNPVSGLKRIKKLLKKDGVLFIAVPGVYFIHKSSGTKFENYFQNAHAYYFTLKTLTKMASLAGLKLIHGDESVFAIFKKGTSHNKPEVENYKDELKYLEKIQKYKYLILFKEKLENYLVNILVRMNLLDFLVEKYHSLKKHF